VIIGYRRGRRRGGGGCSGGSGGGLGVTAWEYVGISVVGDR